MIEVETLHFIYQFNNVTEPACSICCRPRCGRRTGVLEPAKLSRGETTVNYSRRELGLLLPALAAATAAAQNSSKNLPAEVFKFEDLPVKVNKTNRSRAVLRGETHSGFPLEMHLTELDAGEAPHPPHKHVHEEIFLLREGVIDVTISGQTTRLTPGSVAYIASNELHGIVNIGSQPAHYFVIALGNDNT